MEFKNIVKQILQYAVYVNMNMLMIKKNQFVESLTWWKL